MEALIAAAEDADDHDGYSSASDEFPHTEEYLSEEEHEGKFDDCEDGAWSPLREAESCSTIAEDQ